MKRIYVVLMLLIATMCLVLAEGQADKNESVKQWRIALCNDYAGNSWRQQMLKDWDQAVSQAKAMGLIAEGPAFTTNESSAAEQAAQIQNLILEGFDAIVLDAASPTALNGAVKKAVDAGIPVIAFDNNVTEPSAYNLIIDFEEVGESEVKFVASKMKGGNILEIRGLAGTSCDDAYHTGITNMLKKYPEFTVVGEVYGNWTQSVAQKEVAGILPSLPEIAAVVTQGGDGYGAVKAFQAAGRDVPIICMGNRQDELAIWKELKDESGYETYSGCSCPGSSQIALWVAIEVLNGTKVPNNINLPPLTIGNDKLDYFIENTPKGGVATLAYPREWAQQLIANARDGKPAPADPIAN